MTSLNDENTIFLTKPEAERIQLTVENRLRACSERAGRPREPRDSKDAISQATGASLMADMADMKDALSLDEAEPPKRGGSLPVLAVGVSYPPCAVSLKDLQPMSLVDLKMDTHHRGYRLTLKRVSPVVVLAARSWAMVQDETVLETERLEIVLHKSRHGNDVLESSSFFVIKEPYFTLTDQGEATLMVDHPTDLAPCTDEHDEELLASATGNSGLAHNAAEAEEMARMWKEKGNAALERPGLQLAHASYTRGLKLASQDLVASANPDLARDISRNRAYVNLLLNQLDEARADAKASLIGKEDPRSRELDSKAYFRAGCAAYNLGEYSEAKSLFEQHQKLAPSNNDADTILRRIDERIHEQQTGSYNFKKIRASLPSVRPWVDAATFIGSAVVRESPGKGRGLFATCDISPGELIMCEKAFCVVWGDELEAMAALTYDVRDKRIRVSPMGLTKSVVQKLLDNPSKVTRLMEMYGDDQGYGATAWSTDEGATVDAFRVHDIVSRNAFGLGGQLGDANTKGASTGLWVQAARMNHSCVPNVEKEYIGDLMVVRAARRILEGEEIFTSYDESSDYDTRKNALMTTWGFECNCSLCIAEQADDVAIRRQRQKLASDSDALVRNEHWANAKRLVISRAQRLSKAINDTYDSDRYDGLPRMAARRIEEWLAKAVPQR